MLKILCFQLKNHLNILLIFRTETAKCNNTSIVTVETYIILVRRPLSFHHAFYK
uniref:Uncharacterized protein n=1 Tax=Papilio xuthus TaxID=66420 RepID=I4DLP4_PAPXU|nr:unknown unsecreted protein [Papilio xuthus]